MQQSSSTEAYITLLNIKVKFHCYNVKAYESRARKINMNFKLFWKKTRTCSKKNDS